MITLYTFLDAEGNIIEQIRADNHDEALKNKIDASIDFHTDFYSESLPA